MRGTGDLAEMLAAEVAKRGYTQAAAAESLGVSQQTLSRWLSGAVQPGNDKLPNLSEFLDVPVDDVAVLRAARPARGRQGLARRVAELEEHNADLETRLARLGERMELLAARLDRLIDR